MRLTEASTDWLMGPWAIAEDRLDHLMAALSNTTAALEKKPAEMLPGTALARLRDGVAVIPVVGPIFRYENLFTRFFGVPTLDRLAVDFNTAVEDPAVEAVVLSFDSPGGQATGVAEMAELIRGAARTKPIIAHVGGSAQSAAYWLAAAADEVVVSPTALVGSVGVVLGVRRRQDQETVEIVSSQTPLKRAGMESEEGRAALQATVDALAQVFIEDVARMRGMSVEQALSAIGRGASFVGKEAVARGLADSVAGLESLLQHLAARRPSSRGVMMMSKDEDAGIKPEIDLAYLEAHCADLLADVRAQAAYAERMRILGIQALSLAGHEKLIAELVADPTITPQMAAVRILQAEKAMAEQKAQLMYEQAVPPVEDAAPAASQAAKTVDPLDVARRAQALVEQARANGEVLGYAEAVKHVLKEV